MKRSKQRRPIRVSGFDVVNTILLVVFTLLMIYPLYQCLIISFSSGADIANRGVVYLWPRVFSTRSYVRVLQDVNFLLYARNSFLRTVLGSVFSVAITSMFAYAISHRKLRMRPLFVILGLITIYLNGGLIPTFIVIRDLGLYDNFLVYILPEAFNMFYVLVFLAYFKSIPDALEESALVDGASEITIFFRIMLPVVRPVIACITLFVAVFQWNRWLDTMIYTDSENLEVLSYYFAKILIRQQFIATTVMQQTDAQITIEELQSLKEASSLTMQMATMLITIVPIMCVYPFLQKHFVKGIMIGSIKG
jgi:putative aldouronate transport system permease protein